MTLTELNMSLCYFLLISVKGEQVSRKTLRDNEGKYFIVYSQMK